MYPDSKTYLRNQQKDFRNFKFIMLIQKAILNHSEVNLDNQKKTDKGKNKNQLDKHLWSPYFTSAI